MKLMKTLSAGVAAVAITTAFTTVVAPTPANAQQTTSDIRGAVTDEGGAPIGGATVVIRDVRTGTTRTTTTDSGGRFAAQNLSVTGSYTITVTRSGYQGESLEEVSLTLGDTTFLNFDLASAATSTDEIIVVATRSSAVDIATGPSATFDFSDLQNAPAINRDIKDVIRTDPRLFIDQSNANGVQCAGASPRFNSLTVDGVRLNDNFGLNSNGFPTERLPFSFDAIEQVAVELAPFDVQYGGFTACNINAVTRSGSNEIHGSAFVDYTNDALRGGSIEGSSFDKGDFREIRWGATLSGPIIKDKLFFFVAYEELSGANVGIFNRGPAEAGAIGVEGVSQAQLDRILNISNNIYGYDPGLLPSSASVDDRKILGKLDWNINDNHRATFTYNRNNGFNFTASDDDPDEYEFFNHYYERGAKLNAYSGQLFSNWTDNLSTEVRVSYQNIDQRQIPVGGTEFGEVQINTENNGSEAIVYLGADDSRHANDLNYNTLFMKFKADYVMGDTIFTAGFERETIDIFNLFIQEAQGEYRFASIDDFEMGLPSRITYENAAFTNNPDDAAANFKYSTNTVYLQGESSLPEKDITITMGLRYDFYTSGDQPPLNPDFEGRRGFDNQSNLDGKGLMQPRVAVTWEPTDQLSLRAGGGIFSGGNPNVWISNNYSNNGVIQLENRDGVCQSAGLFDPSCTFVNDESGQGRPIFGIPQDLFDAVANGIGGTGGVNALDPTFKIPSQWKASLGATYDFPAVGGDYRLNLDYIYTKDRNAATVVNAGNTVAGTAPDGRPIFANDGFDDFILTNNDGGRSHILSAALSGDYDFGFNWSFGYAYTNAKDRNPMTSSVAFSNFVNIATSNANDPALATANYEVPHRFVLRAGYERAFIGDFLTKFNLFGTVSQSRPFSYTFSDPFGSEFGNEPDFFSNRALLYVPTGPSDPLVAFDPGFDQTAFFNFVDESGLSHYAGMIAPRNAFQSSWFSQWDVRIEQELPGLMEGHRSAAFVVIENVGNLINDEWGVINQAGFPGTQAIVELGGIQNGQYVFDSFITPPGEDPVVDASVWEIRFGLRYEF